MADIKKGGVLKPIQGHNGPDGHGNGTGKKTAPRKESRGHKGRC